MHTGMDWWTKIRLEVPREESSKREILQPEGIGWDTLKKIWKHPEPPGYRMKEPRPKPKIGPYLKRVAQIIEEDKTLPKKQRHTAKRIYERIRAMGYVGKYTQVKEAVKEILRVKQEVFMPLIHRPGEAQVDFGHALAKVSGNGLPPLWKAKRSIEGGDLKLAFLKMWPVRVNLGGDDHDLKARCFGVRFKWSGSDGLARLKGMNIEFHVWPRTQNVGTLHVMVRENPLSVAHEGEKYRCMLRGRIIQ